MLPPAGRLSLPLASLALAASLAAGSAPTPQQLVTWRFLGPFRAGWAMCGTGVPGQSDTFYFGAADGGLWRSRDAGRTWQGLFQHELSASIGAVAVAPSRPATLYVGTGQVSSRYDATAGTGVYRSDDAGETWRPAGLTDSQHVGRISVDPRDPERLVVAALGHVFGPSAERGVFRSTDGGRSWQRTLFVDEWTGAVDLARDPAEPDVLYASTWGARQFPWLAYFRPQVGPGSGIHKSTDGGATWVRLARGLPEGPLGRIGLAVAPSRPARVYASVDGPAGSGGLFRSDDAGATWQHVNPDRVLGSSYFGRVAVDPRDAETVFVMDRSVRRSTDGGRSFEIWRGAPGGDDFHFMWISPEDTRRMLLAADQGTIVSVNGGESWSSWYNQPTGQFYRLGIDARFPYRVLSAQQDSGSVSIASRSDYGQLTFRDWHPVGADERDQPLADPRDPDTVFATGLGGHVSRWDGRTGRSENVSPWPVGSYGRRPDGLKYRYTWIAPLAFSPLPPHALYAAAQMVLRTTDQGHTWQELGPDLTGAVPGATGCDADVTLANATACGYGVVFALAPSPVDAKVLWAGTDNGRVQVTFDGGSTWQERTPPGLGDWSKVASLEASPHDPQAAWAAVDRHRLDDFAPYVYRTSDGGRSWSRVDAGLPTDAYVNVVREDPVTAGLLYAGTRRGVFVSCDGGRSWAPLQQGLPTTGVNDLKVQGDDLAAATQGRGLWVLDDVSPLRALAREGLPAGARLFPPSRAVRVGGNENRDTPLPREEPAAPNPPAGVALDYFLPEAAGRVELAIFDEAGRAVRQWASDQPAPRLEAERYFEEAWLQPPPALSATRGFHRFYWDLRGARPPAPSYDFGMAAVPGRGTPLLPQGALVLPGRYEARLSVDGRTLRQPVEVQPDPRSSVSREDLAVRLALHERLSAVAGRALEAAAAVGLRRSAPGRRDARLDAELAALVEGPGEWNLVAAAEVLAGLLSDLEGADGRPTEGQEQAARLYVGRVEAGLARWAALRRR